MEKKLEQCDLSKKVFEDVTFDHCHFHCVDLRQTMFEGCHFKNCSLSEIKWDGCRFRQVIFEECKLVGCDFYLCDKTFFSPNFRNSILLSCNFSNLMLKRVDFRGSKLKECFFNETNLIEADFRECDLEGTTFHRSNLNKADFRKAVNYSINPQVNELKKAKFSVPEVLNLLTFFEISID